MVESRCGAATYCKASLLRAWRPRSAERDPTSFSSPSLLLGKIAAKDIAQGKQLTADDFNRGGNQATVTVPVGMRAIAVTVDQGSGVGTLIRTGDYAAAIAANYVPAGNNAVVILVMSIAWLALPPLAAAYGRTFAAANFGA